jgi:asparagine synthase (glutamine-hydrolysing)
VCGIYGGVSLGGAPLANARLLERMGRLLHHRGPDAHATRISPNAAFGAERLRVFDPTPAGDQPFTDPTERIWVVLNGAIYNAPEIRLRYSEYPFRSRSDAETVVPLYLDKGPAGFSELDGMFAIAIYDARVGELVFARDRAGEKPLFYCRRGDEIWFASEIQALLALPGLNRELDIAAIRDFVGLGYVTEPKTMFRSIRKVGAGTCLTFSSTKQPELTYWTPDVAPFGSLTAEDAATHLESLLLKAVQKQLAADVPVGIFTSGGVDSSLLAALASHNSDPKSVRTFSVGFVVSQFDESPYARQLASFLGTQHRAVIADEKTLSEALGVIVENLAEPSADPAILPTYLLSRAAREHVTVVLGGEGADELFGGYPTYLGHRAVPHFQRLPNGVRHLLKRLAQGMPASLDSKVSFEFLAKRFFEGVDLPFPDRHMYWFGTAAGNSLLNPELLCEPYDPPTFPDTGDPVGRACSFDYRTYLRDNLLTKVDRATMLASLEARAPYLDRDVTAFALALDSKLKVRGSTTKWLLKQVARRWLPRSLVFRRKRGLSVPVATWLNAGLRPAADRLLDQKRIERQGLLHPDNVRQLLVEHRSRRANHGRALWTLLMLQYWLERWVPERGQ